MPADLPTVADRKEFSSIIQLGAMPVGDEPKTAMALGSATMKLQAVFKERRCKAASGKLV